ncbi:peptide/nickel transport system permease protein [Blastococcus sp. DSM 46786]|uniref:ABC transporter permease n=1 Tax=Blastococcus sp. DSM 46786 TaxID=1798227 RepID=UPI0008C7A2B2|nr:ABC transporter permease [Blastococcus sp. DSM 46786]SEL66231.1 peptide/nickel transport system permease protein [Blastococcus sp. DSM 46786]
MTAVVPGMAGAGKGAPAVARRRGLRWVTASGPGFVLAVGVLVLLVLTAVFAPLIAPADPYLVDLSASLAPPGPGHLLGADDSGRDILSRLVYGARTSLLGPLAVVAISTVVGVAVGLVAGWRGGWVDAVLARAQEVVFAFPGLLVAVLAVAVLGPGQLAPVLAMAVAFVPYVGRLVRSLVMQERQRTYVSAYQVGGFSSFTIAVRHVLPNIAGVVLAQAVVNFGYALMDLAALSYLGLGVQPPTADWGAMVSDGQTAILEGALVQALAPGVAIVVAVVAFTVVGEGVADRLARRETGR